MEACADVQTSTAAEQSRVLESMATSTRENELRLKSVQYQSLSASVSTASSEPCLNGPADSPMNMSPTYQQAASILKSQSQSKSSPVRKHVSFQTAENCSPVDEVKIIDAQLQHSLSAIPQSVRQSPLKHVSYYKPDSESSESAPLKDTAAMTMAETRTLEDAETAKLCESDKSEGAAARQSQLRICSKSSPLENYSQGLQTSQRAMCEVGVGKDEASTILADASAQYLRLTDLATDAAP